MKVRKFILFFCFLIHPFFLFAQKTDVDGLYRYMLPNGLELFVAENNSAPLAYIEIAVRTGAVSQNPQTAGLFHLYEHMMFKGNARYDNQQEVTDALNKMGVGEWNGSTGIDRVNYYFTIPSNLVKDGLEFWSYAVRTPKMDEKELENEKGVVLSEINGNFTNPGTILFAGLSKNLFAESPWRLDSSGNPDAVRNATVAQLKQIQSEYYVPNNSAIFVGGDVHHEQIYKYVKKIYGDWKPSNKVPFAAPPSQAPFSKDVKYIYKNPGTSKDFVSLSYYLRGPDGESDSDITYSADVWSFFLDDPEGIFVRTFTDEKTLEIPDPDYIGGSYYTRRASGIIGMYAAMLNTPVSTPLEKSEKFMSLVHNQLAKKMLESKKDFSGENIRLAETKMQDSKIYKMETAAGILSELSAVWASCGSDYYFNYEKNISAVSEDDIKSFVNDYINNKSGIVIVSLNPDVYEKYKESFLKAGYLEMTSENSFWWRKD